MTDKNIQATASGKAILIGEHAVVYGFKALAMTLPEIQLKMTLDATSTVSQWEQAWHIIINRKEIVLESAVAKVLTKALAKAFALLNVSDSLAEFIPQKIFIDSQIPLGGGMGGSAAISTCLVRMAAEISKKILSIEDFIYFANEVDSLFHSGKASGLDVSTVASNGIIEFQKEKSLRKILHNCRFWLALVDSGERSETCVMIEKVKKHREANLMFVDELFQKMDQLAVQATLALQNENLTLFSQCLNETQSYLVKLGVSTQRLNEIIVELRNAGALAAKLTGAGGGGLILSVFTEDPHFLIEKYGKEKVYITRV